MIPKLALLGVALLVAAVPGGPAATHYVPQTGDSFDYYETIVLNDGVGNYTGYTEHYFINGTEDVTAVAPDHVVSASYSYTVHWVNNTPASAHWSSSGSFTFSASTFRYVSGTDNQTGDNGDPVWFYMNNSLAADDSFSLLADPMHVVSTDATFASALSPTGYVAVISSTGTGEYERDDVYGVFTASYVWNVYFDPATGYIVGYQYTEQDRNGAGDGFTWTDDLAVTHTTYPLTAASAPPAASSPTSTGTLLVLFGVILVIVIFAVVVAYLLHSRHRGSLPQHSPTGRVNYYPGPVGPPPPPIGLVPSGQPPVQQIVMRETVKVACRYCGTLIDATATVCPNCGAPRT